jgi:phage portal protein BeeE
VPATAPLLSRISAAAKIITGTMNEGQVLNLLFPGMRANPPPRGTLEFLRAYNEMPWLRAVLHRVAGGVASARLHTYAVRRKVGLGPKRYVLERGLAHIGSWEGRRKELNKLARAGELIEIEENPLIDLMHKPNARFIGLVHRKLTQVYADLVGEAYWMYERGALGEISGIWNVPPNWVRNIPTPAQPYYILQGYGGVAYVPPSEILMFREPDPVNPFGRGAGTARALSDELETDEYAAKHTRQFFFSGARPDYFVIADGANRPELTRLQQRWMERAAGFWRAWQPMFLNTQVQVQKMEAQTFREMQFTDLRRFERDTIIQTFGVPPEILGIIETSNRATIDAADYLMARHVISPRLEINRETIQEWLVPLFDERLILEYDSPVSEDKSFQLEARKAQPGTVHVDEWRETQGLEPLGKAKGGGLFLYPNTTVAAEEPGGGIPEPVPPGLTPGATPPPLPPGDDDENDDLEDVEEDEELEEPTDEDEEDEEDKAKRKTRRRLLVVGTKALRLKPGQKMRRKISEQGFADLVQQIADKLAPKWRRLFIQAVKEAQGRVSLDQLARALASGDLNRVERLLQLKDLFAALKDPEAVPGLLRQTTQAAGDAAAQTLGDALGLDMAFDAHNPAVVAWLQSNADELLVNFEQATGVAVREVIETAFKEGLPVDEAAKLIQSVIGLDERRATSVANFRDELVASEADNIETRVAKYAAASLADRALTIARTETIRAANGGQNLLWQQAADAGQLIPERTVRVWIVTEDDRLDTEICEPMDGQEVGLEEPFVTGEGEEIDHPPAHPNCRCAIGLRILREEE